MIDNLVTTATFNGQPRAHRLLSLLYNSYEHHQMLAAAQSSLAGMLTDHTNCFICTQMKDCFDDYQ
jgi:hypothetical protein